MAILLQVRELYRIPKSSREFEAAFNRFYDDAKHERAANGLHGTELEEFLDFLDEVLQLEGLNPGLFRKALHSLWSTCNKRGMLPKPYIVSEGLSRTGDVPMASGGYANVWMGELTRNSGPMRVCIKTMKVPTKDGSEKIEKTWREEVSVWMRLKHPNVVQCLGATANPPQIIVEWMPEGEVMECVQKNSKADRLHFVLGLTEGLHYLHSRGVIHGDLKPQNVLVNARGDACISDFGLAIVTRGKGTTGYEDPVARGRSSLWAAPEILTDARVSKEADMFSYGLVAVGIFKGGSPWGQVTTAQVMTKIILGERPVQAEGANAYGLTTELWISLTKCWHAKPEDRITISEILEYLRSV
ncbi:kinase-like protein [Thelephora ganbajun]|uniref:Kinase-like protein n=1 Tax=Thelephora ganbajun TaxID=370292 RepID=A0ACB6Z0W4_THEGA|nr:kinase-like protein [Thelephora ganbajun]